MWQAVQHLILRVRCVPLGRESRFEPQTRLKLGNIPAGLCQVQEPQTPLYAESKRQILDSFILCVARGLNDQGA
jgi:hypothetical protein